MMTATESVWIDAASEDGPAVQVRREWWGGQVWWECWSVAKVGAEPRYQCAHESLAAARRFAFWFVNYHKGS